MNKDPEEVMVSPEEQDREVSPVNKENVGPLDL